VDKVRLSLHKPLEARVLVRGDETRLQEASHFGWRDRPNMTLTRREPKFLSLVMAWMIQSSSKL
jgi:hypothetical protein